MPARRRYIDPATNDYLVVNGALRNDETHASTVVLLLTLRKGSCAVAPELGNAIFDELKKLGDGAQRRAEQLAEQALAPLTRSRRITNLNIVATIDADLLSLSVEFTDPQGRERTLTLPIPRGA